MKLVILGAGGHARVVLDAALTMPGVEVLAFTDARGVGPDIEGVPVAGPDDVLPRLRAEGASHGVVGVGSVRPGRIRAALYERIVAAGLAGGRVIHAAATVADSAQVGEGSVVLARAVVNPGSRIGCNVIVNTGAIVEHDCEIGDHVHISPGAVLGGEVVVGTGAHIGIGSTVLQGIRIGRDALVGGGAVVIRDVPDGACVVGVPARERSERVT